MGSHVGHVSDVLTRVTCAIERLVLITSLSNEMNFHSMPSYITNYISSEFRLSLCKDSKTPDQLPAMHSILTHRSL